MKEYCSRCKKYYFEGEKHMTQHTKEKVTFNQLSLPLKIAVCLAWFLGVYTIGLVILGFIIGVMDVLA
jgi:hypothetical protein